MSGGAWAWVIDKELYQYYCLRFSSAVAAIWRVKSYSRSQRMGKKISSLLSSCPSLKLTWVGEDRGLTPSLGPGRLLWIGRQAGTKKQAERNAPTHHTSRHPNGTFVPLMKEAETVRCGWRQASM